MAAATSSVGVMNSNEQLRTGSPIYFQLWMSAASQKATRYKTDWDLPQQGEIKANFDSSNSGNPGKGGYGAVFRDRLACIKGVFVYSLGITTCYITECEAIFKAAEITHKKGWHRLLINSDSQAAVVAFNVDEVPFYATSDERIIEIQGDGQKVCQHNFLFRQQQCRDNVFSIQTVSRRPIVTISTNYLGHFLLTKLLLDNLETTAKETGREGRVVNVSSVAHKFTQSSDWTSLDNLNDPKKYKAYDAYCRSKLSNVLQANELSTRLQEGANVTANSLHPGLIPTNIARYVQLKANPWVFTMVRPFLKSVKQGAATTCYLALHPDVKGVTEKYFDNCNETNPSLKDLGRHLWDFSQDLLKNLHKPM
ncbi:hypothetical protein GIB67_011378 [Kingdonia uniflora]|uniref:RNase H type-1 domain-containing protein n=1 Tax=Kingdonia uniflora TaxID=39325 RepID=A0A7J7M3M9_9MAGN|nr:hypothetical protein GIB67_011378 [Kingdonia uniflora]